MTPLQVYASVLAQRRGVEPPHTSDKYELRRWLKSHAISRRERQINAYLSDAASGKLGRRGGYGTLKYVLWWLRDYAGPAYPAAARGVLRRLLDHPEIPLEKALDQVDKVPAAASFAQDLRENVSGETLADLYLKLEQAGRWLVAVNPTRMNLIRVAFRYTPADLYVAASTRGSVVKVRRGCDFPLAELVLRLGEDWVQPYPDLALCQDPADRWEVNKIIEEVKCLKNGNAASASCASDGTGCGWTGRPSAGSRWIWPSVVARKSGGGRHSKLRPAMRRSFVLRPR